MSDYVCHRQPAGHESSIPSTTSIYHKATCCFAAVPEKTKAKGANPDRKQYPTAALKSEDKQTSISQPLQHDKDANMSRPVLARSKIPSPY